MCVKLSQTGIIANVATGFTSVVVTHEKLFLPGTNPGESRDGFLASYADGGKPRRYIRGWSGVETVTSCVLEVGRVI